MSMYEYQSTAVSKNAVMQEKADEITSRITGGLAISVGVIYENAGAFFAIVIDILLGFIAMSMSSGVVSVPATFLGWTIVLLMAGLSFIASAVQYVLWKIVFTIPKWWKKIVVMTPAIGLMIIDTGFDCTLANWLRYRRPPTDFPLPMAETDLTYWGFFFFILIGAGFNEAIIQVFRNRELLFGSNAKSKRREPVLPTTPRQDQRNTQQKVRPTHQQRPANRRPTTQARYLGA